MKFLLYIFCVLLFPISCLAQFSVAGKVINQADTKPVANVSVFLSNATNGDKTANDGSFLLKNVKPGKYDLVVSIIGYESYNQPIVITNSNISVPDIVIFPKTIALNEVKIKPKDDTYREHTYKMFKDYFLGTTDMAQQCTIKNPELLDLDFDDETGILTASSPDFLVIENDALGYRIQYLLKSFELKTKEKEIHYEGYTLFNELRGTAAQEKRWAKNREDVYANSSMHFLRSAIGGQMEEQGFRVQLLSLTPNPKRPTDELINAEINFFQSGNKKDSLDYWIEKSKLPKSFEKFNPAPLNEADIIKSTDQKGIYSLGVNNGALYISYNKNHQFSAKNKLSHLDDPDNKDATLVNFNLPRALFQASGVILDPGSLSFSGAWGNNRVATNLPSDYEPQQSPVTAIDSAILKTITGKSETYTASHPIEKVYLHLDKPVYFLGDTIWFKAYTVINEHHQPSALSGVLYVELYGSGDSVITRQTLQLTSGLAWSNIPLSAKLKQGNYHLRAYTNWMRNIDAAYFYNQTLQVIGPIPPAKITQRTQTQPDVQFFPEGGDLVSDVRCKVAIKAINQNGLGEDVKGTIIDNDGNVITDFATQHLGMGVFAFTPQKGKTYKAKINAFGETAFTVDLPRALDEGFTLSISTAEKDSIHLKVAANDQLFKLKLNSRFYLVGKSGGKIYYTAAGKLESPVFTSSVEKKRFPSGIAVFTLFAENGEPINERAIFIQNDDTLKLSLNSAASYDSKQKVNINLSAKDNEGSPAMGNFSVAVINESSLGIDEDAEGTILNNLLLTSDLKGHIEKPNYYFANPNEKTRADLDVLMLTQGYRKFEWKKILSGNERPVIYKAQKLLELTGNVQTPAGKPVPGRKVMLVATKESFSADTVTDINGNFTFKNINLSDTTKVLLSATSELDKKNVVISTLKYDSPLLEKGKTDTAINSSPQYQALLNKNYKFYRQLETNDSLLNLNHLKEVVIKSRRVNSAPDLSYSANLNGGGNANQVIMSNQLSDCGSLADCLNGKVNFASYNSGNGRFYSVRAQHDVNEINGKLIMPAMVVILDGTMMDGSTLNDIDPKTVYSVEVLQSGTYLSIYGLNAAGGAFVITTKRYDEPGRVYKSPAGLITFRFNGFHKAREFYTPKYLITETGTSSADLRSTIYWNPNIITDKNGKASFEFFNADTKGTYRVVIEGIDDNGNLGRRVYRYKVE